MTHKNFLKLLLFFVCMSFFLISGGGKALAANSWYVVKGTSDSQIKYYQDSGATSYSNKWSSANSSTNTADDLNTFLNGEIVQSGDTVYIKAGEYKLSGQINLGDKEVEEERFVNINPSSARPLHLYGGFAGTETNASDRNFSVNITTLNANANSENPRRVFCITSDSTVDGFTITGGHSPLDENGWYSYGGGISIRGSYDDSTSAHITPKPTINNCTITGNTTTEGTNGVYGGGIYIANANPTITNCIITGNTAKGDGGGGGGIYINGDHDVYDYEPITPTPTITNCTITGNTADSDGGGIFIDQANPTFTNCTIADNNADSGAAIKISSSNPTFTNCTIANNTVTGNWNGDRNIDGSATFINCTIVGDGFSSYDGSNLRNTLVYNNEETFSFDYNGSTVTYDYKWENPVSSDVTVNGVTNKVFFAKNNHILYSLYGRGVSDSSTPTADQLGNARSNPMSIGAVEIELPTILSADITRTETITAKYGKTITSGEISASDDVANTAAAKETIITIASLDNAALNSNFYSVSWDVVSSTAASEISIDKSGDLIVKSTKPAGTTYEATVKAQATFDLITTPTIISNTAEKKISITIDSGDINLTLTSKDFPSGKVNTVYSEDQYFTAAVEPSSADFAWEVEGLPAGLSFDNGMISGTPTEAGNFNVKVVATAKLKNYYDTSRDIQISMFVESGDINLTLTSKDLPDGKVNTVYSEDQYFTATATPSSADISWEVDGLPTGLNFDEGMISGTPTEAGNFSVKITVTATLANYNTVSKDIEAELVIEGENNSGGSSSDGSGGSDDGSGSGGSSSSDDGTQVTDSDLQNMDSDARAQVKSITFSDLSNLKYLIEHLSEFSSLTTVTISSDVDVSSFDFSSLPADIPAVSISGNTSIQTLNLKECKVPNIDASNCAELISIDVSGNPYIKSLNVSNTGISTLNASYCTSLTSVDCSAGVLTGLNIEGCKSLENVNFSGNSFLTFDMPADLVSQSISIDCAGQTLYDWEPSVSLNFDEFVQSPDVSTSSLVSASATKITNVENLKAYDSNGKEIEIVTSDDEGNITFASIPYTMKYDYYIGDIKNTSMDVTISAGSDNSSNAISSSGGGCNAMRNEELGMRNVLILLCFEFLLLKLKFKRS